VSDSNTTNLGLVLPEPYGSDDTWGVKLNNNLIIIDTNSGIVANNIVNLQTSITTLNTSINVLTSNIPTTGEAEAGSDNTKFMTSLRTHEAITFKRKQILRATESQATGVQRAAVVGWNLRQLNTMHTNNIPGASLSSNNLILPAGEYLAYATFAFWQNPAGTLKPEIYNLTDATSILTGSQPYGNASGGMMTVVGYFVLTATKTIQLRQYHGTASATNGLGVPVSLAGYPEVYAELLLEKVV
jgi:hypothetical protein